jgi:hypothetical protein
MLFGEEFKLKYYRKSPKTIRYRNSLNKSIFRYCGAGTVRARTLS